MSPRRWQQRIRDILEAATEIRSFTAGISYEQFVNDLKTVKAVIADFAVIGEAAGRIPDEVAAAHPQVPWQRMRAMRNKLVHIYFNVDTTLVWETIENDLPPLIEVLKKMVTSFDAS